MKSPNGQYEILTRDYGEIRMGSPEFGIIEIRGASFITKEKVFGVPMAFSPDSRFLAAEQLIDTKTGPHTCVVVFDFERQREIIVHDQNPGFVRRFTWSPTSLLTMVTWSHLNGEREYSWQAPEPKPPSFLKRLFG
jgi:hypothetical protein